MDSQLRGQIVREPAKPMPSKGKRTRLLTALLGWVPFSVGTDLRNLFYKAIFHRFGDSVNIRSGVTFTDGSCVEMGERVQINPGSTVSTQGDSRVILESEVFIDRDVRINCRNSHGQIRIQRSASIDRGVDIKAHGSGKITIGRRTYIGPYTCLSGYGDITIGSDCLIASHTSLYAHNYNFNDLGKPIREQGYSYKGISIGDNCWLGSGIRIVDGVTIGSGSVIGAGSVVTKDIPPNSVALGVPARVVRSRAEQVSKID